MEYYKDQLFSNLKCILRMRLVTNSKIFKFANDTRKGGKTCRDGYLRIFELCHSCDGSSEQ